MFRYFRTPCDDFLLTRELRKISLVVVVYVFRIEYAAVKVGCDIFLLLL